MRLGAREKEREGGFSYEKKTEETEAQAEGGSACAYTRCGRGDSYHRFGGRARRKKQ